MSRSHLRVAVFSLAISALPLAILAAITEYFGKNEVAVWVATIVIVPDYIGALLGMELAGGPHNGSIAMMAVLSVVINFVIWYVILRYTIMRKHFR